MSVRSSATLDWPPALGWPAALGWSASPGWPALLAPTAALLALASGLGHGVLWPRSNLFGAVVSRRPPALRPRPAVALTLEWNPQRRGAGVLLDRLLDSAPPAAVFVSAQTAQARGDALEALREAGHEIGSRGNQPAGHGLTAGYGFWRRGLDATDDAIADATGRRPRFFRPPSGLKSPAMLREAAAGGQASIVWARRLPPRLPARASVAWLAGAGAGAVLDLGPDPLRAADRLPNLLTELAVRGLRIDPLPTLLCEP